MRLPRLSKETTCLPRLLRRAPLQISVTPLHLNFQPSSALCRLCRSGAKPAWLSSLQALSVSAKKRIPADTMGTPGGSAWTPAILLTSSAQTTVTFPQHSWFRNCLEVLLKPILTDNTKPGPRVRQCGTVCISSKKKTRVFQTLLKAFLVDDITLIITVHPEHVPALFLICKLQFVLTLSHNGTNRERCWPSAGAERDSTALTNTEPAWKKTAEENWKQIKSPC